MYINLLTDDYIPDEAVVHEDDTGLTYYENGSWKFLEPDEYEAARDNAGTSSGISVTVIKDAYGRVVEAPKNINTTSYRFYTDYFGLNSFAAANREFAETSGMITDSISVTKGKALKLHADVQCGDGASVEFSIVDGSSDKAILPVEITDIQYEKLSFGLPLRFHGKGMEYFRDGKLLSKRPEDEQMADGATYTVSYTPLDDAYEVTPAHDTSQIKVIMRVYDKDARMPEVSNIRIEQEAV